MTQSEPRRFLSRLMAEFGSDGFLVLRNDDLVPGAALRWPACRCGNTLCPDYEPPPPGPESPPPGAQKSPGGDGRATAVRGPVGRDAVGRDPVGGDAVGHDPTE